ncbi:DUF4424 domain-containing protein [Phenylobacterium aquaticum]|uniref:DUF4424 domain-containing protein n=1 Tax=Phenylobacterium aquaticum TaxID=1763816 RepID=UPI001F5E078E|nr:DUF4424 domain-containing protein [Phenylobacterium aquaticum]MCI3131445.1 DUF4424 domain-containing protein [Phenylobacterium aquaticum]
MRRGLGAAALLLAATPALANDSTAELAAGGLVLTRSAQIRMASEDLFVSATEVRVRYHFRNLTDHPITARVAFPMPDVISTEEPLGVPTENPENLLDFATLADGVPVRAQAEQKAVVEGVDRTALLRGLGVPLAPHLGLTRDAMDRLTPAQQKQLLDLGVVRPDEYDAGKGWERHLAPLWTLKTAYHWEQTFPAGRDLVVDHRYKPATGGSVGTLVGSARYAADAEGRAEIAKYCMDRGFLAAATRTRKPGQDFAPLSEQRIAYVLKTGANWAGPIGDFSLTVDKGAAANLVSFCAEGVRKFGPTLFQVKKTNFTPARDLDILILVPNPELAN